MKVSIALSVPDEMSPSQFSTFRQDMTKAWELGYRGIELNVHDPSKIDRSRLFKLVSDYDLEVSSIITGRVYTADGLSLTDANKTKRRSAVRKIKALISLAETLSALVLIGWVRGRWEPRREKAHRLLIDSLRQCGEYAENKGVPLGIEPINRYEVDSIHTIDEAGSIVDEVDLPNLGIVPDTFHMNIEEHDPIHKAIRRCGDRLFHLHIADNNRKPPGMGCLPFRELFDALRAMKYDRFISVEVVPLLPDFETVAKESMRYLRRTRVV